MISRNIVIVIMVMIVPVLYLSVGIHSCFPTLAQFRPVSSHREIRWCLFLDMGVSIWLVDFMENPQLTWLEFGVPHDSGNLLVWLRQWLKSGGFGVHCIQNPIFEKNTSNISKKSKIYYDLFNIQSSKYPAGTCLDIFRLFSNPICYEALPKIHVERLADPEAHRSWNQHQRRSQGVPWQYCLQ